MKTKAFTFMGDNAIYQWDNGRELRDYQGLCVVYHDGQQCLFRTWLKSGERNWLCVTPM